MTAYRAIALGRYAVFAAIVVVAVLLAAISAHANAPGEIDVTAAAGQLEAQQAKVLDVREPSEWNSGVIQGAILMPLGQVAKRLPELSALKDQPLYVVCASGGRSAQAVKLLSKNGFTQLSNVKGGMNAWRKEKLPMVAPPAQ